MEGVRVLGEEIGPRAPCSEAESRAAQWCSKRLRDLGYLVEIEEFDSRPCYQTWYAAYIGIALLGSLLLVYLPLIACLLGVVAFILYSRDADGRPLLRPRGGTSRNVVAKGVPFPKVVVVAHLDSALSSLSFPRLLGSVRASVQTLNVALLAVVALGAGAYVVEAGGELHDSLWVPAGLLALYLTFALGLQIHAWRRGTVVAGANDNASGVEVLLRLAADRPSDAWFVVTGSEESGMVGMQDFVNRHGLEVAGAWFLNIDNVGKGRLIAAEEEGVLMAKQASPEILRVAEAAGADAEAFRAMPTDATVLLSRRYRALSLLAVGDNGVPPNWHRPSDVVSEIDPQAVDRATEVARRVVAARSLQEVGT